MLAHAENGGTGLGFRKSLEAYEAAKVKEQPDADDKNVVNIPKNEAECGSNTIQPDET